MGIYYFFFCMCVFVCVPVGAWVYAYDLILTS